MKFYVKVFLLLCFKTNFVWSNEYGGSTSTNLLFLPSLDLEDECTYNVDIVPEFRYAVSEFSARVFKRVALESGNRFEYSPLSMWLTLAAIAEGSAGNARQELFLLLNLPEDKCMRQQFYTIAKGREYPNNDITMSRKRLLVIDENISMNRQWEYFVRKNHLIEIITAPLNRSPDESLDALRQITSSQLPNVNLNGNSLLLNTVDYKFIPTTAFSAAKVERVPFYNDFGEEIGTVNMLKIKKRVRLAYLPDLKFKVLELTDGYNSRFRLYFGIAHGNDSSINYTIQTFKSDIILKILNKLRMSKIPLDIGIPQYSGTTEIDVKAILEEFGVKTIWTDIWATRNISNPPVFPSSFVQRVTLTFDRPAPRPLVDETIKFVPAIDDLRNVDTGLDDVIGRDFIVNRPFMLALFDTETYTCIFSSAFSK